ncbi:fimbrial protein [Serratia sp. JSRIV006]|uniref:fimbrial protein n=1 Tax=Serratia sp. JSRIV006 TaxID=2831896 RepID=UPI001CBAE621|nr:fimbrial protein [Serratia sp. JSRIV006]UAN62258.1 fimbrial protein [Serratia sp. JSRIV006]
MKRKLIGSLIAASSMAFPMISSAATTVNGGTIKFTGEVVNAACAVDAGSSDMTVRLGQVRTAMLNQAGAKSGHQSFTIVLKDCDTTVSTKASVAFQGVASGSTGGAIPTPFDNVLGLSGGAAGQATNVGIQLFSDNDTTPLKVDGTQFSTPKTLSDGENRLSFMAAYYATGVATAGSANAEANFKVQYQ